MKKTNKKMDFKKKIKDLLDKTLISNLIKLDKRVFFIMIYDILALLLIVFIIFASFKVATPLLSENIKSLMSVAAKVQGLTSPQSELYESFSSKDLTFLQDTKGAIMGVIWVGIIALFLIIFMLTFIEKLIYSKLSNKKLNKKYYFKKLLFNMIFFTIFILLIVLIFKVFSDIAFTTLTIILMMLMFILFFVMTSALVIGDSFLNDSRKSFFIFGRKLGKYLLAYIFVFIVFVIIGNIIRLVSFISIGLWIFLIFLLVLFFFFIIREYTFILTKHFLEKTKF